MNQVSKTADLMDADAGTLRMMCNRKQAMIEQLELENRQLRKDLGVARLAHYQQQAGTQVVGSVSHHLEGEPVIVKLTAAGLSLPDGALLYARPDRIADAGKKAAPAVQGEERQQITLSYKQLIEAAHWANPDNDPNYADDEVCIFYAGERMGDDGEIMPAGLWLYCVECPEEGVIGPLDGEDAPQHAPDVAGLVEALSAFVCLAEDRLSELGALSPEMAKCLTDGRAALSLQTEQQPVAWSGWGCQYPGKMPRLYGDRRIAELNCDWENGDQVLYFTAAPQPADQQPFEWPRLDRPAKVGARPRGERKVSDHRLMPVEPDAGMVGAGARVLRRLPGAEKLATQVYRSMCAAAPQVAAPDVTQLVEALKSLVKGYVNLLEAGRDRITSLGGDCDPVSVMEHNDPWLRDARAALAPYRKGGELA